MNPRCARVSWNVLNFVTKLICYDIKTRWDSCLGLPNPASEGLKRTTEEETKRWQWPPSVSDMLNDFLMNWLRDGYGNFKGVGNCCNVARRETRSPIVAPEFLRANLKKDKKQSNSIKKTNTKHFALWYEFLRLSCITFVLNFYKLNRSVLTYYCRLMSALMEVWREESESNT